jgi:RNA polymerase sigma-70 factor (ECF subfamily)
MPEMLLERARAGEVEALDQLLSMYRNYLRLLARTQIDAALGVRVDASDLAQEVLVDAFRGFADFAGRSEGELIAWLRKILVRNVADQVRRHHSQKRDVRREQSLEMLLEQSSHGLDDLLAMSGTHPSGQAAHREQAVVLADALAALPDDYREVIILRHLERQKFTEIGERMGRTAGAVRMLWVRGLERLRELLEET